jgi:hypothetical protein
LAPRGVVVKVSPGSTWRLPRGISLAETNSSSGRTCRKHSARMPVL